MEGQPYCELCYMVRVVAHVNIVMSSLVACIVFSAMMLFVGHWGRFLLLPVSFSRLVIL